MLRASLWTRGAYQRRIDADPPDDVRLLVRATELDDGFRPARAAPSFGTAAAGPVPIGSPDIKVVRRRAAGLGPDADIDGVTFDLEIPHDDIVAGSAADVMVQVSNVGPDPRATSGRSRSPSAPGSCCCGPRSTTASRHSRPTSGHGWRLRLRSSGRSARGTVGGDGQVPRTMPGRRHRRRHLPGRVACPAGPRLPWTVRLGRAARPHHRAADPLTGGPTVVPVLLATNGGRRSARSSSVG